MNYVHIPSIVKLQNTKYIEHTKTIRAVSQNKRTKRKTHVILTNIFTFTFTHLADAFYLILCDIVNLSVLIQFNIYF